MMASHRSAFCGLIALLLALFGAGNARADTLSIKDLLGGRWCSEQGDYAFTRERLTVYFHNGGKRVMPIRSIKVRSADIIVYWDMKRPGVAQDQMATIFQEFDARRRNMAQAPNTGGDMGLRIPFHRC